MSAASIGTMPSLTSLLADPLILQRELRRERYERIERATKTMRNFFRYVWPQVDSEPLAEGFYIDAIADHLEAVLTGEIRNFACNIRPKMGKSTLFGVIFPTYVWVKQRMAGTFYGPQTRFFTTSYSDTYCVRDAVKMKWLIETPWFRARWGTLKLRQDQREKSQYYNQHRGYRIAIPIHGQITGGGGDIVMGDDILSFIEARSPVKMQEVWDLLHGALSAQRINIDRSPLVLVGQRLDQGDPFGRILSDPKLAKDWDLLCLQTIRRTYQVPFLYRYFDPVHGQEVEKLIPISGVTCTALTRDGRWADPRKEGECIAPGRISANEIERLQGHAFNWASQEQQDPISRRSGDRKFSGWNADVNLKSWSARWPKHFTRQQVVEAATREGWQFSTGWDHGIEKGTEVCVLIAWHPLLKIAHVIDCYVNAARSTPTEDAKAVRRMLDTWGISTAQIVLSRGDINSSGKESHSTVNLQLRRAMDSKGIPYLGFPISSPEKTGEATADGVDNINTSFLSEALFIDPIAAAVVTAVESWQGEDDEWKHKIDALRYVFREIFKRFLVGTGYSGS